MKDRVSRSGGGLSPKEHYKVLRRLSCGELWRDEVPKFDRAGPPERLENVAVVRAVGVVFSESGTAEEKAGAREWLRGLLRDPEEKIRRYAAAALPKIGADAREEGEVLELLERAESDREKRHLGRTLEKIGGAATLEAAAPGRTAQKAAANVARASESSGVDLDAVMPAAESLRIHLRCRRGLERIVEDELHERGAKFRLLDREPGALAVAPVGEFTLADVYALRCFHTAGIGLGTVRHAAGDAPVEEWAAMIASEDSRRVLETLTTGPVRYRLEFVSRGHQRGRVREITDRVYAKCPQLLNDSRNAPWQIEIRDTPGGSVVELTPRFRPDPRLAWRRGDVPAASHPPLAACMVRLAGDMADEVVWDPFCGSGLELAECALRGGVRRIFGTDRSADAVAIAGENLAAAMGVSGPAATFVACDFRDHREAPGLGGEDVSLMITNPPMGRRVPIPNLGELIADLFEVAATVLRPGGRLVFANPLPMKPAGGALKLEYRQKVDLGGFDVHLEKYVKGDG